MGAVILLVLAEIGDGEVRQQLHKAALGLGDQRGAVGQKEDVFHPALFQQHFAQGNGGAGLAGAGGHDQQGPAAVLLAKAVAHGFYGPQLIPAPGYVSVHLDILQAGAQGQEIEPLLQIPLGVDSRHRPLRVLAVDYPGVKAVGEENHRAAAVLLFQDVGIELCLLAAHSHVHTAALSLYHGQGPAVIPVEHIVGIAQFRLVGHPRQLHLIEPVPALYPSGVGEHGVYIELAGLVLGELQGLWHIAVLLLPAPGGELFPEPGVLLHKGGKLRLRDLRDGDGLGLLPVGQAGVELPFAVVLPIAAGYEVQEHIEVFQTQQGLLPAELFGSVAGVVAGKAYVAQPLPDVPAYDVPEVLAVQEVHQLVLVGHFQVLVHGVHPFDGQLHGTAAAEYTDRRVYIQNFFRRDSRRGKGGKLLLPGEYVKVGHGGLLLMCFTLQINTIVVHLYHQHSIWE